MSVYPRVQNPASTPVMKPIVTILLLVLLAACSGRSKQQVASNDCQLNTATATESHKRHHLYDMPLKGIINIVKKHLHC